MAHLIPIALFALLIAPAIRLLSLAARTRRTPEIWAGLYFFGTAIGIPLRVLGHSLMLDDPELATQLNSVGHVFFAAATVALTIFTWRVFRPAARWAQLASAAIPAAITITTVHVLAAHQANAEHSISMLLANFFRIVPISWAFLESAQYWRVMRRREAIGLADPIVTNRFLLWSFWTGAFAILPAATLALRVLGQIATLSSADATALEQAYQSTIVWIIRILFLITAPVGVVALSLSFFPPARYLRFVRESHGDSNGIEQTS